MNIRINKIEMSDVEPFNRRTEYKPSSINLFYGKNESGKSVLTRSILSSLFKTDKFDDTINNKSKITVSGLTETDIKFSISGRDTIENYVLPDHDPLISDLSRLCVVSQGNLSLDPAHRNSIQVGSLRGYFSDQALRKRILDTKNIPTNTQNAELKPYGPEGKRTGDIGKYLELEEELYKLDTFFKNVNENYADSKIQELDTAIQETNIKLEKIKEAKINYAYTIYQERLDHKALTERYPADTINEASNTCQKLREERGKLVKTKTQIESTVDFDVEINWAKTAIAEIEKYQSVQQPTKNSPNALFFVLAVLLIIAMFILYWKGQQTFALGAGVLLFLLYMLNALTSTNTTNAASVVDPSLKILDEFRSRSGIPNPSIAAIKTHRDHLIEKRADQKNHRYIHDEMERRIQTYVSDLRTNLMHLGIAYDENLDNIETALLKLKNRIGESNREEVNRASIFGSLNIDSNDVYEIKNADVYDKSEEEILINSISNMKAELEETNRSLTDILNIGRSKLGLSSNASSMNEILDGLRKKREDLVKDIRKKKAEVIAGIMVTQYFTDQSLREDLDIKESISNSQIQDYIQLFTDHYTGLTYAEDIINVLPDMIPLSELSTGTQEQVLLAIRFGILQHHLNDKQMFIILDDAFQHSDWDRREHLVDSLGQLAEKGWQILYFTMDDHIRDLFETRLKPKFGDEYKLFSLSN